MRTYTKYTHFVVEKVDIEKRCICGYWPKLFLWLIPYGKKPASYFLSYPEDQDDWRSNTDWYDKDGHKAIDPFSYDLRNAWEAKKWLENNLDRSC